MGRVSASQEENESCGQRVVMAATVSTVDLMHISPQVKKRSEASPVQRSARLGLQQDELCLPDSTAQC